LSANLTFQPTNPTINQTIVFTGLAAGGTGPYTFTWNWDDSNASQTTASATATHAYTAAGPYTVTLTVTDSSNPAQIAQVTVSVIVSSATKTSGKATYTLSFRGYDWDGGGEHSVYVNNQFVASLPTVDSPQNGGVWRRFTLNITSFVVTGMNMISMTDAGWDCGVVDSVRDLVVINGTATIYSNSTREPLSCTIQPLVYNFSVGFNSSVGPRYTLVFQGYDWDGGAEHSIYINNQFVASLPTVDSPQNARVWVQFTLDITQFIVPGVNVITITDAGWDCGVVDSVRNLMTSYGTNPIYSNSTVEPLSCAIQPLVYDFQVQSSPALEATRGNYVFLPISPNLSEIFTIFGIVVGEAVLYCTRCLRLRPDPRSNPQAQTRDLEACHETI
jgi:PKD repeat protein